MTRALPVANDREATAIYEALVLLRMFIAKGDRRRLPYSEGDVERVQQRVLTTHPHLAKPLTGRDRG